MHQATQCKIGGEEFQQKRGVDYNEIFSPIVKMITIRLILGIVASEDLHLKQMDVVTSLELQNI